MATFNCINDCLDGADCAAMCLNKGHAGDYKREPLKWPNFDNLIKNIPNFVDTGVCISKCDGQDVCINRCITARTPGKLAVLPDLPLQIPDIANGIFRVSKCNWNVDCMASAVYSMVTVPGYAHNGSRLAQRSGHISPISIREDGLSASNDTTHVAVPRDVMRNHSMPAGVTKRQDKREERFSHNVTPIVSRSADVKTHYRQEILDRLARHKPEVDGFTARCEDDAACWAREFPDYLRRDFADRWRLEKISGECGFVLECIEKTLGKDQEYLDGVKKYTTPEDKKKEDTPADSSLRKTPLQQPPLQQPPLQQPPPGAAINGTQPPVQQPPVPLPPAPLPPLPLPPLPLPPVQQPPPGAATNGTQPPVRRPLRPDEQPHWTVNGTQPPLRQPLPGAAVNGTQPPVEQPPLRQPLGPGAAANGTQPPFRQPFRPGAQPHWTVNGTRH